MNVRAERSRCRPGNLKPATRRMPGVFRRNLPALLLGGVLVGALVTSARADDLENCLFCHQYRGLGRYNAAAGQLHVFYVRPDYVRDRLGPHARLACTDCHDRAAVSVVPHQPVARVDCTRQCHLHDPSGLEQRFTHANVADMLARSAHPPEVLAQLQFSGGPLLQTGQSQCLYCHDEPVFRDSTGAIPLLAALGPRRFDRCDVCHTQQLPVDIAYYLRHIAARLQPERASLELAQVCAVCHSDTTVEKTYGLPDTVASYIRSYHGKAALLGDQKTASCVSCHIAVGGNAHLMLGQKDPRSSVNPTHVADACRSTACHPGAEKALAAAAVHLDLPIDRGSIEYALAAAFILLTIFTFGPSMLIVVLELFALVIGREHHGAAQMLRLTESVWAHPEGRRLLTRFSVSQRVQHWVLAALFALLALTGFPLKFADRSWSRAVIDAFGGLDYSRLVHHWAGLALVTGLLAHLVYVLWTMRLQTRAARAAGQKRGLFAAIGALPMWIGPADVKKTFQLLGYLLHLRKDKPDFGRFTVKEKFEYLGVFWGTTLLGLTGILLWGQQLSTHFISGRFLNLALIAHTYEAFLAIIHVGILHLINVIFEPAVFPLSLATLTGKTPLTELAEEHADQVRDAARELGIAAEGGLGHA